MTPLKCYMSTILDNDRDWAHCALWIHPRPHFFHSWSTSATQTTSPGSWLCCHKVCIWRIYIANFPSLTKNLRLSLRKIAKRARSHKCAQNTGGDVDSVTEQWDVLLMSAVCAIPALFLKTGVFWLHIILISITFSSTTQTQ